MIGPLTPLIRVAKATALGFGDSLNLQPLSFLLLSSSFNHLGNNLNYYVKYLASSYISSTSVQGTRTPAGTLNQHFSTHSPARCLLQAFKQRRIVPASAIYCQLSTIPKLATLELRLS